MHMSAEAIHTYNTRALRRAIVDLRQNKVTSKRNKIGGMANKKLKQARAKLFLKTRHSVAKQLDAGGYSVRHHR